MKNLIKNIFNIKFTIEIPNKEKFLIFDRQSEKVLSRIVKERFNVLPTRLEKISLVILLYSMIINFKDTLIFKQIYFNYLKTFIILSKPSYVITFIDNDIRFFKFKKYFSNIKFIAIQNGYRFFKDDLFESIENSDFTFECDEYYCFGENVKNYLKNKIKGNCHSVGSFKNNSCKKNTKNKKINICFISSYAISTNVFEKEILQNLYKYCKTKKISLEILARTNSHEEEKFYFEIFKNKDFIFHKRNDDFCNSYNVIDSAMISVTFNNTLGYENLARNNKTYFININDRNRNCESFLKFGYPEKFDKEGFFWTNKFDPQKIINKIDCIYNLSEEEWKNETYEITKKIINYDVDNSFLKNKLNQI